MKRFYKFLMPLVAIVAMALPVGVTAQTTCQIKIVGEDAYADGWNGGSLAIMQGTTTVATFTAANADNDGEGAELDSTTVTVADGTPVSFVWSSGQYDDEVTIWIYHSSGVLLYTVTNPTAGTLFTLNSPCSGCFAPSNVHLDSLASDYARIAWGGNASSYGYEYGETATFIAGSGSTGSTTDNYAELSSLTLGTSYTFRVWSDCTGETSDTVTFTFITPALAATLPYTTGFEPTDDIAWEFANDGTNKWFIGTATYHNGANSLYISNDNGTSNAYTNTTTQFSYAYRAVSIDNNGQYAISFDWKAYGEGNYDYLRAWLAPSSAQFTAGHSPDGGTSASSYTTTTPAGWIDLGGKMNLQSSWQTATATPTLTAGTYYLVFMWANDGSSGTTPPAAVDNIDIYELSCFTPTNVAVSNLSQTSFDLTWTAGSNESEWVVNFNDTLISVTDTSYSFTGLTANHTYVVSVAAVCGAGDTSFYSSAITVVTPCDFFDSLPYVQNFESATTGGSTNSNFVSCWTRLNNGTSYFGYPYVSSSSSYNHTTGGSKGLYWYNTTTTGTYGDYQVIVLPGFDPTVFQANQMTLKFWAKASSSSYEPVFKVGVMTNPNDINSFTEVATINVLGTTWTEYEAYLSTYTGTGNFVAIRADRPTSSWYAYVDDITLDLMPACPAPVDLTVDSVSTEDIYIHWTPAGSETSWTVTINDSLVADATDTAYTFTGLTRNHDYTITVAALCDGGDTSNASSILVRTLAGQPISQFPYSCGFEVDGDNDEGADWVLVNGTQTNQWHTGTATNNGGTRALYISNDNGTSNSYTISSTSNVFAYATFSLQPGEYVLAFDWKAYGESCCDYLKAAIVPGSADFTAGNSNFPSGSTTIGSNRNVQNTWQNEDYTFNVTSAGIYKIAFLWHNDGSVGTNPPAAIDNIQLSRNTCPKPVGLEATYVTSDSITVTWHSGSTEASWLISNGNDTLEVTDSTYTYENLNANTTYNIRVRAICSGDDTSMWASLTVRTACGMLNQLPYTEDFENQSTTSSSNNNFIPCWAKVNNATSTYYPYVSNSTTYNHTNGGSMGLYWYSSTTTSYGTYRMIVLPGIDTNVIPMNTVKLTFWAKPSSTSYAPVFYVGVMDEQTVDSTFQYYDTIAINHTNTDWQKYTVLFNNFTGTGNYVAIRDNTGSNTWYAYVDDITLDIIPACPAVEDLTVQAGPASAIAQWNVIGNSYTGATVEYKADTATTWNSVTVNGVNYVALTGLEPATSYALRITSICGSDEGMSATTYFNTRYFACESFDTLNMVPFHDTIGNGTTTSTYFPSYSFYNYGLTQQIYTPEELGHAGIINSVAFHMSAVSQQRTYEIYMGHTPEATANQFLNPSDLTLVYNGGPVTMTAGAWSTFNLTTPFVYNGNDNLVVFFRDMTGSYVSGNAGYGTTGTDGSSRYIYQDAGAYVVGSTTGGTSSNFRNNLAFSGMAYTCTQQSTCAAPLLIVSNIGVSTADLAWAPGNTETAWNVYYRRVGDATFTTAATNVTTTNYTVTGLASGTNYEFMVEGVCGSDLVPSSHVEAATLCAKIALLPYEEDFNSWGTGTGVLPNCWYNTGTYSSYSYIIASQNMSGTTGGSIYMYQGSSSSYTGWLIMPEVDTNVIQLNQTQLVFNVMYASDSYAAPSLIVGVMSNPTDNSTFVPVDTVTVQGGINQWEVFEVPLSNYTDSGAYVAIRTYYTGNYTYFYLDNMSIEAIPTCPRPDSLTAGNATTNSVDLAWHERGAATTWIIEYGPRGFQLGTGTTVVATSNPFTLTGLPVAYQGEYYVRSICSSSDSGAFSRRPCAFGTSQIPATLPYNYDFEDATEWANWQTCSNHNNNWFRGTAVADSSTYSMYVSADGGLTYKPYLHDAVVNATAFRDVDFGPVDSSFTMTIRARAGGTTTGGYDGMIVLLADPSIATVPSSQNLMTPWGDVRNLYQIMDVRIDTTWQTYSCSFDTIHGVQRVAFYWFNQNTEGNSSYPNLGEPVAVDNIHIDYSSCPRPVNLDAPVVGSTNATLTWTGEAGANYEVVYREVGSTNQTAIANTNSITLMGLTPNATYRAWVRKLCGVGDTSLYADGVEFTTTLCEGGTEALNFDPSTSSTTSSYSPIGYALYNYSYVQTIIDSANLASLGGDISAFAFLPTNTTSSDYYNNMTVYMANVSESDLSSGFIHPDATHVFQKVIDSASFNFTTDNEWQIHNLDTTFTWDGHSNLLIAVNREHGTYSSSGSFSAHTATASKMRYVYNDGSAYSITSVSGGTASSTVGDIRLISCSSSGCQTPNIVSTVITDQQITINYTGSATNYEVAIMAGSWVEPSAGTPVAANTYSFTGLAPATQYTVGVRAVCDDGVYSQWYTLSVTTDIHPCDVPTGIAASNLGYTSATLTWTPGAADQTQFEVLVTGTNYDTSCAVTGTTLTLDDLTSDVEYSVRVIAICGPQNYSDTSAAYTFRTNKCNVVTGLAATNVTATTATLTWNAASGNAVRYEVEYGEAGFREGNGTTVQANGTTVTLTDLLDDFEYDAYVRVYCTETLYSNWSEKVTFTTTTEGIDEAAAARIGLYPNPASSTVTLTGIDGEATVTVVDMNGREVQTVKHSGSSDVTLDVTGMAQGAYFVRITGERVSAIRKLIVR